MSSTVSHRNSLSNSLSNSLNQRETASQSSSEESNGDAEGRPLLETLADDGDDEWDEAVDAPEPDARRVYGGLARHPAVHHSKGIFEVAFDVAAASLPPCPLLLPYAFYLTGLAIGIPLLFFLGALSWFSHAILAVEGRYVGAISLNGLAASVFPRKYGGQAMSELLVDALSIFVSIGRSAIVLAVSSQLFASIFRTIAPRIPLLANTSWFCAVMGILFLIPTLVSPGRNVFVRPLLLSRLRSFSTPLYLVALIFVGIRLHKGLPEQYLVPPPTAQAVGSDPSTLLSQTRKLLKGIMGSSVWAGISIIVFSISSQQSSFSQQRPLRQASRAHAFAEDSLLVKLMRLGWLAAAFFGLLGSCLVNLAWGLVGYLAIPDGGKQVNVFLSLPEQDGLLTFARVLVLITLLATLPATLRPARKALRRLFVLPKRVQETPPSARASKPKTSRTSSAVLSSSEDEPSDEEEVLPRERRRPRYKFITRLATLVCWAATIVLAISFGYDHKLVSMIEIVSCVGCTLITFLLPAFFFIVLFHIRRARTIFMSDPSVISSDALLMKKEQQLQRRLSGRRAWQDLGVFLLLLPVGVVLLIRGITTLAGG